MRRRRTPEIITGRVTTGGAIEAGDGFSVVKAGTGLYDIVFTGGFRLIGMTASPAGLSYTLGVSAPTERSFRVSTVTLAATAADAPFTFIAVGVQQ